MIPHLRRVIIALAGVGLSSACLLAQTAEKVAATDMNLVVNGDFAKGTEGWNALWTRDPGAGKLTLPDAGLPFLRIDHTGDKDWSLAQERQLEVRPGEIFNLSASLRVQGKGTATLSVVTRDARGQVLSWDYGGRTAHETKDRLQLHTGFIVPHDVASIQCRLIGAGPAAVWVADVMLTKRGSLGALRNKDLLATLTIQNNLLDVAFHTNGGAIEITDRRGNRTWSQRGDESPLAVLDAKAASGGLDIRLLDPVAMREVAATIRLDEARPECVVTLKAQGAMERPLLWPAPFASARGQLLILPVNEGISYPVDDPTIPPTGFILYGGHGLCMPWYGATDGEAGWMALVETPDDAAARMPRRDGLLEVGPEWQAQKGRFGPARVIRYAVFDRGGYVAMAKRYREYAKQIGLFKTLAEKRKTVPAIDLLVGAVNVWCWEKDAPAICRDMQSLGIRRILWSNGCPPEDVKALNDLRVLTSRGDIFQDAMNPAEFAKLQWVGEEWTSDAWKNNDLLIGADGDWVRGWGVEAKDGSRIPCGVLCDRQALAYAKRRIPPELATHPYRCRFIDTTTASPWRECYDPRHPMTRTESKQYKMELLRYVSEECGLVCGSETGHDAAVPYADYFEGMMSLGPYRIPDSGRDMQRIWNDVPKEVAKFQTGHAYRLPLWELVYHDCVVAQWYWGDYSNKLPKLWDRRDLWNALYGTPPMFMFSRKSWQAERDRFAQSYMAAAPVARATGYFEMLSHEWLTPDHAVQRTRFANGVVVTVNFGDAPYLLPDGTNLPPLGRRVEGIAPD